MPESTKPQDQELELQDPDLHGPWPEEEDVTRKKTGPKAYLREHPAVRFALIAAVLILIGAAFFVWRYYSVRESTDDAEVDGHITPISARVSGTVIKLNFQDNQKVQEGDVIVQLGSA